MPNPPFLSTHLTAPQNVGPSLVLTNSTFLTSQKIQTRTFWTANLFEIFTSHAHIHSSHILLPRVLHNINFTTFTGVVYKINEQIYTTSHKCHTPFANKNWNISHKCHTPFANKSWNISHKCHTPFANKSWNISKTKHWHRQVPILSTTHHIRPFDHCIHIDIKQAWRHH